MEVMKQLRHRAIRDLVAQEATYTTRDIMEHGDTFHLDLAELTADRKNAISHRGRALAAFVAQLRAVAAQILITGTDVPQALADTPARTFHVEQGRLGRLL